MVSSISEGLPHDIELLVAKALNRGVLNRRDYLKLAEVILENTLTASDRHYINQVFDSIRTGRVQLAD
ncbi:MAG TPA: hypothetical protein IGR64_04165 [Leptolyngbyaceae cyanobacterium M65_K2018_010]|nr:hypothetical protein [Leptolyngbyaceae cyanobacterium M65_K2018_010]